MGVNMRKFDIRIIFFIVMVSIISPTGFAKTEFDYPELLVAPQASERLKLEAKIEDDEGFFANLPMQPGADSAVMSFNGFSIRVTSDYDIKNDKAIWRFDVLYGVKTTYPELACRILG